MRLSFLGGAFRARLKIVGGAVVSGGACALASMDHTAQSISWGASAQKEGTLVMSGDCGGTNTRLVLFRVAPGTQAERGKTPAGEVLISKHYRNAESASFTECCEKFLAEADGLTGGQRPSACCLACAGGIESNTVTFTNVKNGWTIDGGALSRQFDIPKVKLINDFEAQARMLHRTAAHARSRSRTACIPTGQPECERMFAHMPCSRDMAFSHCLPKR